MKSDLKVATTGLGNPEKVLGRPPVAGNLLKWEIKT